MGKLVDECHHRVVLADVKSDDTPKCARANFIPIHSRYLKSNLCEKVGAKAMIYACYNFVSEEPARAYGCSRLFQKATVV